MNRKKALHQITGGMLLTATSALGSPPPSSFLTDFVRRWQNAGEYSLKVLDKMPEDGLAYRPTPDQMSFAKQYAHAAYWNTFFIGLIARQAPLPEPAQLDKATVRAYYASCHAHCTVLLRQLTDHQLAATGYGTNAYWQQHSGQDLLLRAFMHTAHHRAQTLVYLRLKGIEPPFFEF